MHLSGDWRPACTCSGRRTRRVSPPQYPQAVLLAARCSRAASSPSTHVTLQRLMVTCTQGFVFAGRGAYETLKVNRGADSVMVMSRRRPVPQMSSSAFWPLGSCFQRRCFREAALLGLRRGQEAWQAEKIRGGTRACARQPRLGPLPPRASQCPRPSHQAPGLEPKNHRRAARSWEGRQRKAWPVSLLLCLNC